MLFETGDKGVSNASLQSTGTDGVKRAYAVLPPQDIQVGKRWFQRISFVVAPSVSGGIRDSKIDRVLPTILFQRAFISYAERFAVLEPR